MGYLQVVCEKFAPRQPWVADPSARLVAWTDQSGSWTTTPNAINSTAKIAGRAKIGTRTHSFLWQNGATADLGTLSPDSTSFKPRSEALGINLFGQVVVTAHGTHSRAFVWQSGSMTPIGTLGGQWSFGMCQNG